MKSNSKPYDVVILGAGSAGLSARREVAKHTDNYCVIDRDPSYLGTTCARVGCMPSKTLIQTSHDFYRKRFFAKIGIEGSDQLSVNPEQLLIHTRSLRDRFVRSVITPMEDWSKNHVKLGKAHFIGKNELNFEGTRIGFRKAVIATGSRPDIPKPFLPFSEFLTTTDQIFEMKSLPKTAAMVGLGPTGLELAQAFSRLGVQIVGIGHSLGLGGLTDPELQNYAIETISREFPLFFKGGEIVSASAEKSMIRYDTSKSQSPEDQSPAKFQKTWVEKIFICTGRTPNLDQLNLEALELSSSDFLNNGVPKYDKTTLRIPGTAVYLAGDVNGDLPVLHVANEEGLIAGYNAVRDEDKIFQRQAALSIVFVSPQIARVGASYHHLEKEDIVTGRYSIEDPKSGKGRALILDEEKGMIHIYADRKDGHLRGAELFMPGAEHLAHLLSWAIQLNLHVEQVLELPFYHPVLEEGLKSALQDARKQLSG